jgi:hypothetical protein
VKNGNILNNELNETINFWVNPYNSDPFTQKVSKINKKLKDLLGEKLAKPYLIFNENGRYKINLPMDKVFIHY